MADNADPRDVLFTILRSVQSKGKELPLQPVDVDGTEDAISRETGISRPFLHSLFVKCGILKRKNKKQFFQLVPNEVGIVAFQNDTPELHLSFDFRARARNRNGKYIQFATIKIGSLLGNSVLERASKRRKRRSTSKNIVHFKKDLNAIAQEFEMETYKFTHKWKEDETKRKTEEEAMKLAEQDNDVLVLGRATISPITIE